MANRATGYGFSREVANKMAAKYSVDDEQEVVAWIEAITNLRPNEVGRAGFHEFLKDGIVLCQLMNHLKSGSCPKIHDPSKVKLAAMRKNKEMENISFFLAAAEKYGVGKVDLFQTVDLYEDQNMAAVLTTMFKLGGAAKKNNYSGPVLGVKVADPNKRDFDENKLREGRNIIGLQMGTNQVASQGGMTPYGLGRQLTPQTKQ